MDGLNLYIPGQGLESAGDPGEGREEPGLSFIMFSLQGETFAVPLSQVKEIIRVPHITWMPGAHAAVRGIINLRGTVVAVLELAALLGHPAVECDQRSRIVIAESGETEAGLLVEEVMGVETVTYAAMEQSMRTLDPGQRGIITAQAEVSGRLAGILDVDAIVERSRPAADFNRL